ncbi:DNA kinase/phosphatase Pnk1 [Kickxella alabastrina]|uniref:DNA kinase/phosphatase Pnk1 n=1 Tax=Kickxella alabastrina TaxID=61397 RepID=A0ACC1I7W1_9FUNG|nr:DNA kinase/phosphatase Pnk1 [Kickxella alabastrina]
MTLNSFFKGKNSTGTSTSTSNNKETDAKGTSSSTVQWSNIDGTWIGTFRNPEASDKFAAFDLDKTLVNVRGTHKFPKGADDWQFFHPGVPKFVQRAHAQGYRIVILSNQLGLKQAKGESELTKAARDYRLKIQNIAMQLDTPFMLLAATTKSYMRKPSPGMWFMAEHNNGAVEVNRRASFFVGDAAGRPMGSGSRGLADFSDSDLVFAHNASVPFYTPESVFTDEICAMEQPLPLYRAQSWAIRRFHPSSLADGKKPALDALLAELRAEVEDAQTGGSGRGLLVVLVGPPASGKSTFTQRYLEPLGFERVNMDLLKTRKKCIDAVAKILDAKGFAALDNTNPDAKSRAAYLKLAEQAGAGTRAVAVVFGDGDSIREVVAHNNAFRAQVDQARWFSRGRRGDSGLRLPLLGESVPAVAVNTFFKKFALPVESEGFAKVLGCPFVPFFESADDEVLWNQYY